MSRKKITLLYAKRYRKAKTKKEKSRILDEFVNLTDYNRNYASWLLQHAGKKVHINSNKGKRVVFIADPNIKIKRRRNKIYDREVFLALLSIWRILDYPCSVKLKVMTELSNLIRLFINFFIPSVKLIKKIRIGSKIKKVYAPPETPFQRVIDSPLVPHTTKQRLFSQPVKI